MAMLVREQLASFNESGAKYPNRLRVIIGNFNTDYPSIHIFVPITGEVFSIALPNSLEPWRDTFLKEDTFVLGQMYDRASVRIMEQRIRQYGITREIELPAR